MNQMRRDDTDRAGGPVKVMGSWAGLGLERVSRWPLLLSPPSPMLKAIRAQGWTIR